MSRYKDETRDLWKYIGWKPVERGDHVRRVVAMDQARLDRIERIAACETGACYYGKGRK